LGQRIGIERLVAIGVFIGVAEVSLYTTPRAIRRANDFVWHPVAEVATLFASIVITISPIAATLHADWRGRWRRCCVSRSTAAANRFRCRISG
jgi:hypothetical protein